MPSREIKLGDEIQDVTAKISGIVIGRIEYLNGAKVWLMQPYSPDEKTLIPRIEVEEAYAKKIGSGVHPAKKRIVGFSVGEDA